MIVARRLESRLRFGKLLVTFNLQPDLTCLMFLKQQSQSYPSPGIYKMWSAFYFVHFGFNLCYERQIFLQKPGQLLKYSVIFFLEEKYT